MKKTIKVVICNKQKVQDTKSQDDLAQGRKFLRSQVLKHFGVKDISEPKEKRIKTLRVKGHKEPIKNWI